MNGYTNQYLANTVNAATPEQLLLMLYDGAIRFAALAIKAIEDEQIDKRSYYINKSCAILSEFSATLDRSHDPELAYNLDGLYSYMQRQLMEGNLKDNAEPVKEVKAMLADLRATWAKAVEIKKSEQQVNATGGAKGIPAKQDYKPLSVAL
jgi:flagellar protein FliS